MLPKVRVLDTFNLDSTGLTQKERDYAFRSHFDFVIVDSDWKPRFVVEVDGPQHRTDADTIRRDRLKNGIAEKVGLPLLRIDSQYLRSVGRFTIIGWLTEVHFLHKAFEAAQDEGQISIMEPFDPCFLMGRAVKQNGRLIDINDLSEPERAEALAGHRGPIVTTAPFDPFLSASWYINRASEAGSSSGWRTFQTLDPDSEGNQVALTVVSLPNHEVIIGEARVRSFAFTGVWDWELADRLAIMEAADNLRRYLSGERRAQSSTFVDVWKNRMARTGAKIIPTSAVYMAPRHP